MMRRIDMLRKHDEEDQFRKTKMVGHCDPQAMEREDGTWWLHHLDYPTADHVWFVCDPRGQPFPFSYGYTKVKAITSFLALLNLPDRPATRMAAFCRHTDQPERGKWWGWFKRQGYTVQNFAVNPKLESTKSMIDMLQWELKWANKHSDGCVWCRGVQRFQNIAARLALMVDAIEYYSQRPEEQQRWLATMNKLWNARGRR